MKPKFGDRICNLAASKDNPRRCGYFVRKSGKLWELTDGRNNFWRVGPDFCTFMPVADQSLPKLIDGAF